MTEIVKSVGWNVFCIIVWGQAAHNCFQFSESGLFLFFVFWLVFTVAKENEELMGHERMLSLCYVYKPHNITDCSFN